MNEKQYFAPLPPAPEQELKEVSVNLAGQNYTLNTAENVFSSQWLDKATAILLKKAPTLPTAGNLLDLGCGWGPIALTMALQSPEAKVFATDISPRALDLTKRNAKICKTTITTGLPTEIYSKLQALGGIDIIWSNPPVRIGKKELHDLMRKWLPLLKPTGVAVMVMSKNLGADSFSSWLSDQGYRVEKLASKQGFRVFTVEKA